jgi:PHP domain-containing protein
MVRLGAGPRAAAAVLVLAGLMLTMNAEPPRERPSLDKAGYAVLAVDLHVHSFPGDGLLPPWDIAVEARRRRLDAVALTNHNSTHSWRLAQWLAPLTRRGATLIPGQELTSVGYHLAVIGVTAPIRWRQSAAPAVAAVHAAGGVAIAAHPARSSWRFFDDAAIVALDGVEIAHPITHAREEFRRDLTAFAERAIRVHPSIAVIGSSDFHYMAPLGLGRTYIFARPGSPSGLLDAIREGRTVACDDHGDASGPAELVAMVRAECRRDALSPPDGETLVDRIGTWMVWMGLVALVVLGADEAART